MPIQLQHHRTFVHFPRQVFRPGKDQRIVTEGNGANRRRNNGFLATTRSKALTNLKIHPAREKPGDHKPYAHNQEGDDFAATLGFVRSGLFGKGIVHWVRHWGPVSHEGFGHPIRPNPRLFIDSLVISLGGAVPIRHLIDHFRE